MDEGLGDPQPPTSALCPPYNEEGKITLVEKRSRGERGIIADWQGFIDFPTVKVYFRDMRFPRCDMKPAAEGFYCQCIGCTAIAEGGTCILVQEKDGVYRYNGNTPHGGEYAYLYFTDSAGNLTPRERASYVEVREMDKNGDTLHVDFGIVDDMGFSIKKQ